jgi:hypothetical protein
MPVEIEGQMNAVSTYLDGESNAERCDGGAASGRR